MRTSMTKAGIAHPRMGRGGSENRVMWGIEALKPDHEVSLITAGEFHLDELNALCGSSVRSSDVRVLRAAMPRPLRRMAAGDALRGALYERHCRRVAREFDLLVSAYNLCDFGVPAIHCIADFSWDDDIRRSLHPSAGGLRGAMAGDSLLRKLYVAVGRIINPGSGRNLFAGEDLILANSRWSAQVLQSRYGVQAQVLYPPVAGDFRAVPWEAREAGFVCLGRIAPEKRIEDNVAIVRGVRQRGHGVHLHIIGAIGEDAYGKRVREAVRADGDWVHIEGARYGAEKAGLLSRHRFGIHACRGEAFGIAVAEMVKAGCIPFAPREGGQAEIVNHPQLSYGNIPEAVEKIVAVLQNAELQAALTDHLSRQRSLFSEARFVDGLREAVAEFVARREGRRHG
jgi:glycosyltransferase involved in cell wall biosynthesis